MEYCSACLSSERRLVLLKKCSRPIPAMAKLLDVGLDVHRDYICWECKAWFKRIHTFRKQVILAQHRVQKWHESKVIPKILKANTLKSLSKLSVNYKCEYDHTYDTEYTPSQMDEYTDINIEEQAENQTHTQTEQYTQIEQTYTHKDGQTYTDTFTQTDDHTPDQADDVNSYEEMYIEDCDRSDGQDMENDNDKYKNDENEDEEFSVLIVDRDAVNEDNTDDLYIDPEEPLKLTREEGYFDVSLMSKAELEQARELDRNATVYKRCQYKCIMCIQGYYRENKFEKHLKLKHDFEFEGEQRPLKCPVCECRFASHSVLKSHYEKHFRKYTCKYCGYSHHKVVTMLQHMVALHGESAHNCPLCDMQFHRRQALDYHLKSHTKKHKCGICNSTFTFASTLKIHIKSHHTQKRSDWMDDDD